MQASDPAARIGIWSWDAPIEATMGALEVTASEEECISIIREV